jgi:lipopolysaccharide transport system ATP-binding protein
MEDQELVLKVENVSKQYRLGAVGTGTLQDDLKRWWYRIRGKEDPFLKVGVENDRSKKTDDKYVWALKDINFEVKKGEVLGIIGKNGAGKSTLLKLLSKVADPTTGSVKYKGRIAALLEVGTGFHPELTGRENIFLNGAVLGMQKKEIAAKVDEIIEFSGIAQYVDTPVKRYSSGMKVRLGFAVAAHLEPDILIVDEVLAVGDAEFQAKCIGKMQDVAGEGRTVLFVSHNMASVKNLCKTGIVLQNGKVVYNGSAEDAVTHYLSGNMLEKDVKLVDRTDRIGNNKFKFIDIKFKDLNNNYVSAVISGEPIIFEITYENKEPIDHSKLILGLSFRDENEKNILAFISDEMNVSFNPLQRNGIITLKLDKLLLRGEHYSIRLQSYDGVTSFDFALDVIDHAAFINILPGDINQIGKINRKGKGAIQAAQFCN